LHKTNSDGDTPFPLVSSVIIFGSKDHSDIHGTTIDNNSSSSGMNNSNDCQKKRRKVFGHQDRNQNQKKEEVKEGKTSKEMRPRGGSLQSDYKIYWCNSSPLLGDSQRRRVMLYIR
jgi:hypothetical protein